ncbi:MAG: hypothetical protein ACE5EZ_03385 [Thermodesulfobacteriota bacterium]
MDPYAFTTVIGTVFFEYSHENRKDLEFNDFEETTSTFTQTYGLSLRGNILSRLLMIYDTSLTYSRNNVNLVSNKNINNNLVLSVNTTLIPRSRIPLTLFGTRSSSWGSVDGESNNGGTITTNMGFSWAGNFRVLPVMSLRVKRDVVESGDGDTVNKKLNILYNASKAFGPTVNDLRYRIDFRDAEGGDSSSNSSLRFHNKTDLSRHSSFTLGVTRDVGPSLQEGGTRSKSLGFNMGLLSYPSRFFRQTHNLDHYRTIDGESKSNGTIYSGTLAYRVSKKVELNLSLGVAKQFTESDTSSEDTTNTTASSSFAYSLTDHLSITQSVSANFTETSSSDESINIRDRKVLNYSSTLSYYRKFSRANFNAGYGLGYIWDTSASADFIDEGGQGITHNGSIGLSRIDFNRFFLFNTGASFKGVLKETAGQVKDSTHQYFMNFDNRFWKEYLTMNGAYNKESTTDAIDEIKETEEVMQLSVRVTPIKDGGTMFNVQRTVFFSDISGFSRSNSGSVNAYYGHSLLGGTFGSNLSYSLGRNSFEGGSSKTRIATFKFSYGRVLLRRVMWEFNADISNAKVDDTFSRNYTLSNTAFYRLRAWSLSLAHSYYISQTSSTNERVNTIFFKVGRQFVRMF